ncbi:CENPH protein, partial [Sagittarius serpentarius]|nr:CENPH protein [Sagittarius serpentarius]
TEDLERDIDEVKVSLQNKMLALQRMQLMVALRNKTKENDNDSRLIMETMEQIIILSKAVIEHQQQAREKEQKLADIKRKRLSLKKASEDKLLQIQAMMKKQKDKQASLKVSGMVEKICTNLQKERDVTTVIQGVLQNIVIGSKVNWAEDPSLKAVVLQLEKNV